MRQLGEPAEPERWGTTYFSDLRVKNDVFGRPTMGGYVRSPPAPPILQLEKNRERGSSPGGLHSVQVGGPHGQNGGSPLPPSLRERGAPVILKKSCIFGVPLVFTRKKCILRLIVFFTRAISPSQPGPPGVDMGGYMTPQGTRDPHIPIQIMFYGCGWIHKT